MTPEGPQFDDTRKALSFALNYTGETKAPVMSRMMAQVSNAPKKLSKAARKRFLGQFDAVGNPEVYALAERLLAELDGTRSKRSPPPGPRPVRGLDGAHLAGYVLAHFERLDELEKVVLKGVTIRAFDPCSCGSSCCSGMKRNTRWTQAVSATCEHLRLRGSVVREAGKRGLSTQADMRMRIVSDYYLRRSTTLAELADIGQCVMNTAAKHKEWIITYLKQEEDGAWLNLAAIFDSASITGAFV